MLSDLKTWPPLNAAAAAKRSVSLNASSVSPGNPTMISVVIEKSPRTRRAASISLKKPSGFVRRTMRRRTDGDPDWSGRWKCGRRRSSSQSETKSRSRFQFSSDDKRIRGTDVSRNIAHRRSVSVRFGSKSNPHAPKLTPVRTTSFPPASSIPRISRKIGSHPHPHPNIRPS